MRPVYRVGILLLCVAITGCVQGEEHGAHEGEPSGATCPVDSLLSYENFGKAFMDEYCVGCHSTSLSGASRNGAPSDHNFDSLAAIRQVEVEHIDMLAAGGHHHINTEMPPEDHPPHPSDEERRMLGEWLACGTP
ncbi:MAG: c-type cytochrome [Myxococcales bacterium]|nr:c-type cytochrome [Myxococcales bacterium]